MASVTKRYTTDVNKHNDSV